MDDEDIKFNFIYTMFLLGLVSAISLDEIESLYRIKKLYASVVKYEKDLED